MRQDMVTWNMIISFVTSDDEIGRLM